MQHHPSFQALVRWLRIRNLIVLRWLGNHLSHQNIILATSVLIGLAGGLAAVVLKSTVHFLHRVIKEPSGTSDGWAYVFFPAIGILCTFLVIRYFIKKPFTIGLSDLILKVNQKKHNLPTKDTFAHIITSALTVGFGGSAGLEAPIVRTGSAIGARIANFLRLGQKETLLFLACGAAAGMASIFNSPIAGLIFAIEILLVDVAVAAFVPLLIASAIGSIVGRLWDSGQIFFLSTDGWSFREIPLYFLLGLCTGWISVYMIRVSILIRRWFDRIQQPYVQWIIGSMGLAALIFLMPPLFGEGYQTVNHLLDGVYYKLTDQSLFFRISATSWGVLVFGLVLLLSKTFAFSFTVGAGGNGGIFAPSMFSGALTGFLLVETIQTFGLMELNAANFIAAGMAGVISGVIKAPLTGIFLIAEITQGYALFVPLMLVSAVAYFTTRLYEPYSVFTKMLYSKGLWVPPEQRDRSILIQISLREIMETNFSTLHPDMTLGTFTKVISKSQRNVFPVVNDLKELVGVILLDDVRKTMFDRTQYDSLTVKELMFMPPTIIDLHEPMEKVMDKFEYTKAWNLPVVEKGVYQGFVSQSSLFNKYRTLLQAASHDV